MDDDQVKEAQREFFRKNKSGCAFAAYAAKGVEKYGWHSAVLPVDCGQIASTVSAAISDNSVQALSMIFPAVQSITHLIDLVDTCILSGAFTDEGGNEGELRFVRLRAQVGSDLSWVSGFAPFDFLPLTRQAPFCELTIRVKARPDYDWHFKSPVEGVIHLADLDMQGLSDRNLRKLWDVSFETTKKILGHAPDEESAAKTTFVIPLLET